MRISGETITVLKNFAQINPNLLIPKGNRLRTMAVSKNVIAEADVAESFPVEFGIYDLSEFIGVLDLFKTAELKFADDGKSVTIKGDNGGQVKYWSAAKAALFYPEKEVNPPEWDVNFKLAKDDLKHLMRASAAIGAPDMVLGVSPGVNTGQISMTDSKSETTNRFDTSIDLITNKLSEEPEMVWKVDSLQIIPDDYEVSVSSKRISQFNGNMVNYYVSLMRE